MHILSRIQHATKDYKKPKLGTALSDSASNISDVCLIRLIVHTDNSSSLYNPHQQFACSCPQTLTVLQISVLPFGLSASLPAVCISPHIYPAAAINNNQHGDGEKFMWQSFFIFIVCCSWRRRVHDWHTRKTNSFCCDGLVRE